ncbi:NAD(P)H-dependent oxidoreductase [Hankyongella ginsenosidimutans]|uniref:NAD(P)H-dependent oxidoreductase n=1 Tax=Hankyongella ginsenosidimutans TaxID=1763828 RepID=UPI001FE7652E|nr:NAD(P)H-dependent oxidoreductase [Hankyongella ginsenosidimutans]
MATSLPRISRRRARSSATWRSSPSRISRWRRSAFFSDAATHGTAEKQATMLSDELIAEIEAADDILITVPMYNFGVPSALKAWIDQIVRVGRTFSFDGQNFGGLVTGKRAFIVIAYGAAGYAGDFKPADFVAPISFSY